MSVTEAKLPAPLPPPDDVEPSAPDGDFSIPTQQLNIADGAPTAVAVAAAASQLHEPSSATLQNGDSTDSRVRGAPDELPTPSPTADEQGLPAPPAAAIPSISDSATAGDESATLVPADAPIVAAPAASAAAGPAAPATPSAELPIVEHVRQNFGAVLGPQLEKEVFQQGLISASVDELYQRFQAKYAEIYLRLQQRLDRATLHSAVDDVLFMILSYAHGDATVSVIKRVRNAIAPELVWYCLLDPIFCQKVVAEVLTAKPQRTPGHSSRLMGHDGSGAPRQHSERPKTGYERLQTQLTPPSLTPVVGVMVGTAGGIGLDSRAPSSASHSPTLGAVSAPTVGFGAQQQQQQQQQPQQPPQFHLYPQQQGNSAAGSSDSSAYGSASPSQPAFRHQQQQHADPGSYSPISSTAATAASGGIASHPYSVGVGGAVSGGTTPAMGSVLGSYGGASPGPYSPAHPSVPPPTPSHPSMNASTSSAPLSPGTPHHHGHHPSAALFSHYNSNGGTSGGAAGAGGSNGSFASSAMGTPHSSFAAASITTPMLGGASGTMPSAAPTGTLPPAASLSSASPTNVVVAAPTSVTVGGRPSTATVPAGSYTMSGAPATQTTSQPTPVTNVPGVTASQPQVGQLPAMGATSSSAASYGVGNAASRYPPHQQHTTSSQYSVPSAAAATTGVTSSGYGYLPPTQNAAQSTATLSQTGGSVGATHSPTSLYGSYGQFAGAPTSSMTSYSAAPTTASSALHSNAAAAPTAGSMYGAYYQGSYPQQQTAVPPTAPMSGSGAPAPSMPQQGSASTSSYGYYYGSTQTAGAPTSAAPSQQQQQQLYHQYPSSTTSMSSTALPGAHTATSAAQQKSSYPVAAPAMTSYSYPSASAASTASHVDQQYAYSAATSHHLYGGAASAPTAPSTATPAQANPATSTAYPQQQQHQQPIQYHGSTNAPAGSTASYGAQPSHSSGYYGQYAGQTAPQAGQPPTSATSATPPQQQQQQAHQQPAYTQQPYMQQPTSTYPSYHHQTTTPPPPTTPATQPAYAAPAAASSLAASSAAIAAPAPVPLDADETDLALNIQSQHGGPAVQQIRKAGPTATAADYYYGYATQPPLGNNTYGGAVAASPQSSTTGASSAAAAASPMSAATREEEDAKLTAFLDANEMGHLFNGLRKFTLGQLQRWPRAHLDEVLKLRVCSKAARQSLFDALHPDGVDPPPMTPPPEPPRPTYPQAHDYNSGVAGYGGAVASSYYAQASPAQTNSMGYATGTATSSPQASQHRDLLPYGADVRGDHRPNRVGAPGGAASAATTPSGSSATHHVSAPQGGIVVSEVFGLPRPKSQQQSPSAGAGTGAAIPAPASAAKGAAPANSSAAPASKQPSAPTSKKPARQGPAPRGILCLTGCKRFNFNDIVGAIRFYADVIEVDYDNVPVATRPRRGAAAADASGSAGDDAGSAGSGAGEVQYVPDRDVVIARIGDFHRDLLTLTHLQLFDRARSPSVTVADLVLLGSDGQPLPHHQQPDRGHPRGKNQQPPAPSQNAGRAGNSTSQATASDERGGAGRKGAASASATAAHPPSTSAPSVSKRNTSDRHATGASAGDAATPAETATPPHPSQICRFYHHPKGCGRGEGCKFLHLPHNSDGSIASNVDVRASGHGHREPEPTKGRREDHRQQQPAAAANPREPRTGEKSERRGRNPQAAPATAPTPSGPRAATESTAASSEGNEPPAEPSDARQAASSTAVAPSVETPSPREAAAVERARTPPAAAPTAPPAPAARPPTPPAAAATRHATPPADARRSSPPAQVEAPIPRHEQPPQASPVAEAPPSAGTVAAGSAE